jgi:hypothetical protein
METLRISMLGTNRQPLEELIAEAASAYSASQACRTAVHSVDQVGPLTMGQHTCLRYRIMSHRSLFNPGPKGLVQWYFCTAAHASPRQC